MRITKGSRDIVVHAALAAAMSAAFNGDWARRVYEDASRAVNTEIRPYLPLIVGGAALYILMRR